MGEWLARHPDVLPILAAGMAGILVWRAYRYGCAVGFYRLVNGEADRIASEALGG